mmetsp:Transcript_3658/g.12842  ORF Transcript_3658/g.12842 Transcript_3658/m.12842 type:complete len:259 (+) Transcript_3658:1305-2081(+)
MRISRLTFLWCTSFILFFSYTLSTTTEISGESPSLSRAASLNEDPSLILPITLSRFQDVTFLGGFSTSALKTWDTLLEATSWMGLKASLVQSCSTRACITFLGQSSVANGRSTLGADSPRTAICEPSSRRWSCAMTRAKSGRRRRRPCSYSHRSPSDSRRGTREKIHLPLPTSHSATRPSLRVPPDPPGIATASVSASVTDPWGVLEVDPAVQDGESKLEEFWRDLNSLENCEGEGKEGCSNPASSVRQGSSLRATVK